MESGTRRYRIHGVTIVSEVPLVDAHPWARNDGTAEELTVSLERGEPVGEHAPPGELIADNVVDGRRWYVATRDADLLRFRMPRIADFVITDDLRSVTCRPDPAAPRHLLPVLVSGNVLAFVLALGGHSVLHASAVQVEDEALAVVGYSNAGKSTFAALLCLLGAPLVTDDLLRLEPTHPVTGHRGGRELRLRPTVREIIDQFPVAARRMTADGRWAVRPSITTTEHLPLRAALTLQRSTSTRPIARRLTGADALFALLCVPRTMGWRDPEPLQRHFEAMSEVAGRVPVYLIEVPERAALDSTLAGDIVAQLGLRLPAPQDATASRRG